MKFQKLAIVLSAATVISCTTAGAALASSKDSSWIKSAVSANMLEIKAGRLAESRATNKTWRSFGEKMVSDHTKALGQLHMLARDKHVMVSTTLAPADESAYRMLDRKRGSSFQSAYVKFAVMSHEQANALYNSEIAKGRDSDARAVAAKQLPTIQNHLTMADKLTGMKMRNLSKGVPKP